MVGKWVLGQLSNLPKVLCKNFHPLNPMSILPCHTSPPTSSSPVLPSQTQWRLVPFPRWAPKMKLLPSPQRNKKHLLIWIIPKTLQFSKASCLLATSFPIIGNLKSSPTKSLLHHSICCAYVRPTALPLKGVLSTCWGSSEWWEAEHEPPRMVLGRRIVRPNHPMGQQTNSLFMVGPGSCQSSKPMRPPLGLSLDALWLGIH